MITDDDILAVLKRHWGYGSFLPLQKRIIASLIGGHDVCAVMPTGGGKSLCYQLPAVLSPKRTVVVISPLIALMQDQVSHLTHVRIPSAMLNSTLTSSQSLQIMRNAVQGQYRLLYLSPERLANPGTVEWLRAVPIAFFAIDEAHCISEWGHDFRPEYRELSSLRRHFSGYAIAAFTASATRRVRHDIITQLQLHDAHRYIASFHRPNLRYIVRECNARTQPDLLVQAVRNCSAGSIILYAPTIARVEQTVAFLREHGIAAVPYHGQMDAETRSDNQEQWMSGRVRVLVGTIAFGLGINKPDVRAVIHLSLPKSMEQYYQEVGRAGRDGLASRCILMWQKRDAGLLAYFIDKTSDPVERERGWQRYNEIKRFVESKVCRHRQICLHFGETSHWHTCGACDVCCGESEGLVEKHATRHKRSHLASFTDAKSSNSLSSVRKTHAKAYERWLPEDDDRLKESFRRGMRVNDIAASFQRKPGAIRSRLKKLGL
jgi:ATP-dependent DNA helicase RecQ